MTGDAYGYRDFCDVNLADIEYQAMYGPHERHPQPYQGEYDFPANKIHQPDVGPMLGQRRRRWTNIGPTLGRCVVFSELVF